MDEIGYGISSITKKLLIHEVCTDEIAAVVTLDENA